MTRPLRDPDTPPRLERRLVNVMIVDDAVVVRGLMSRWLNEHPRFNVVACARNGRVALEELERGIQPDIVILDLDMPEVDGLTALPLILRKCPTAAVLVASTLTRRNAEISLRCLSLGALDYLPKPETNREVTTSLSFRQELVLKLEALAIARGLVSRPGDAPEPRAPGRTSTPEPAQQASQRRRAWPEPSSRRDDLPAAMPTPRPTASGAAAEARPRPPIAMRGLHNQVAVRCLMIGASTGGPRAVADMLGAIGPLLADVPVVVVQHMPPIFTSVFAEHLRAHTGRPAREPLDGERLQPGTIFVAPGGRHFGMALSDGHVVARLDDGPPVNFCRPSVDVAFLDAAEIYGASALAVVLTGMGHDGLGGTRALYERGATIVVQDEATSTVWGMPGSIARAGLASAVLPLPEIGASVARLIERGGRS